MNNIATAQLILMSEVGIALFVIAIIAIIFIVRFRLKQRKLTENVISQYKQLLPERKEQMLTVMQDIYHLNPEDATQCMEDIYKLEKSLYSRILKIFYRHEYDQINYIDRDIQALEAAYISLSMNNAPVAAESENKAASEELAAMERKVNILNQDNERLKEDLKRALESVDRIQTEYLAIYEKHKDEKG
jgi:hypothetical protein